jgi:hypothetical protein
MRHNSFTLIYLILFFSISILSGCKKDNSTDPIEVTTISGDQLPAITQSGANSFGCMINGNVWIPKGSDGNLENAKLIVDPNFSNGNFTFLLYKIYDGFKDRMTLSSDSIKNVGTYIINTNTRAKFIFGKSKSDGSFLYCDVDNSNIGGNPNQINGFIKITRYDLVNKIFSGEFEITFNNNSCGYGNPVKITNGRFDYKL